jgi:hypothetical protein
MSGAARRSAAIAACLAATAAAAQDVPQDAPRFAPLAEAAYGSDTDGLHSLRARAGGLLSYENPWSYAGVVAQSTRYTRGDFEKDATGVLGVYRDQRRDTLAGVDIEAGVVRVSGHLRPVGDATWRIALAPSTSLDFIASADLVETPVAIDRGIGYTFAALGAEQRLGDRFTATALGGIQSFSDGNSRTHLRARLIFLAWPDEGITAQLRYRRYASREADVGGAYFNPDTYQQWLAVGAIRKRHAGWILSAALGAGRERSSGIDSRAAYLAEARAEGPIGGGARLLVSAGYHRSAGFVDSPDYAYRFVAATVIVPFR